MNYQVLARRYRPRRFEEVVGQEPVAATLRGAIRQDRLAHAYLFTGPRGVGKTSMARIFAKALNCPRAADRTRDQDDWGRPCDSCSTCAAIHLGQDIDVVELDGASHRGIDNMRSIIEAVNRPATRSLFKIYIIDEVHMLTREAFNALLKTLEEPPGHVKFVFATTEAHRIPETVLSRCQRFDFHPIEADAIVRRLVQILTEEERAAEDGLLERIAGYCKGGLRDAQTLLDQLMTFSEGPLRLDDLDRITGRVPAESVTALADAALSSDPGSVLRSLRECFETGADPAIVLEQIIEDYRRRLHGMLREQAPATATPASGVPAQPAALSVAAGGVDRLLAYLQILLDAASKLKYSPFAEVAVEVVLLKLARLEDPVQLEEVIRSLAEIEKREASLERREVPPSPPARPRPPPAAPPAAPPPPPSIAEAPLVVAAPVASSPRASSASSEPPVTEFGQLLAVWGQVQIELEGKHPDIAPYLGELTPSPIAGAPDSFSLEFRDSFCFRRMKSPPKQASFLALVREVTGAPWKVRLLHEGQELLVSTATPADTAHDAHDSAGPPHDSAGPPHDSAGAAKTPAPGAEKDDASPQTAPSGGVPSSSAGGISKDPIVKKSVELFSGRLI